MNLIYASPLASTSNVAITQGIADKVFNVADPVLKTDTGALAVDITGLKDSDTRLQDEIAKVQHGVACQTGLGLEEFKQLTEALHRLVDTMSADKK